MRLLMLASAREIERQWLVYTFLIHIKLISFLHL
jgi:hypothetical protein